MITSVHIADVGMRGVLGLRLKKSALKEEIPGLRDVEVTFASSLGETLRLEIQFGRAIVIATWEHEEALDKFLADHPVGERLSEGWHVRLRQMRIAGSWSKLSSLNDEAEPVADSETEPVAVLTISSVRLPSAVRFFKASAPAEGLALRNPGLLAGTAMGRPPNVIGTFTLWRNAAAMRDYAVGRAGPEHLAVIQANNARTFYHESAFVRFRPSGAQGMWDGREPLAEAGATSTPS
jgi:hypothetical protein